MKNIRLKIPGELFWATQYPDLPSNQAEINNNLLTDQYHYGDRVEFDEDRNVVRLIKTRAQVAAELKGLRTGSDDQSADHTGVALEPTVR